MSRKNKSRLAKKQKRRDRRKTERSNQQMENEDKTSNIATGTGTNNVLATGDYQQTGVNNTRNENTNSRTDQEPSTSKNKKKQRPLKKNTNPRKSVGNRRVYRFKKIVDNQARKLARRSVSIVVDNQTPRKVSSRKKGLKRLINSSPKGNKKANVKLKLKKALEEGEIDSDEEGSFTNATAVASTHNINGSENYVDDDDDCVVIEPTLDEITVDDNDEDDNIPSSSDVLSNYHSLINSFENRSSSTPCHKNSNYVSILKNSSPVYNRSNETLPFFVDIGRKSGIDSADTFKDYTKLSTLRESSMGKRRSVYLKSNGSDEIIDLDDSHFDSKKSTIKRKSGNLDDDSVIFISETNKNDFIPIIDNNIPPHKILKIIENPTTPVNRVRTNNNLFTRSETKKLNAYNDNAYNPSADQELTTGKRLVIIDGSNVAFKHGLDQEFSVKGLKIAIDYFEKIGHEVKAVIPQFRMNKHKSKDPEELERLHKAGKIVQTPCKNLPGLTSTSYDDRFILQLAFELDAAIVSNDNYRDLLHENPAFKKIIENRVIGYTWCNDIFILPKDPYGKWGPTLQNILNRC